MSTTVPDHAPAHPPARPTVARRAANDPAQYDELADEWWRPRGAFAPLHWLAAARADLVPAATRPGSTLLDLGCGGGLLAPHVVAKGHRHLGVDVGTCATQIARQHGVLPLRADVHRLPLRSRSVDVVVAGELFEHVHDLGAVVAEIGRVLRPGGHLLCDTLAATRRCKVVLVTIAERLPAIPRGIHDPALFVDPGRLQALCAGVGIDLVVRGIRPSVPGVLRWLVRRADGVPMVPVRSTGMVYQGVGRSRG